MIKITYPGTNNFSDFVYDPLGRNVKIVETTAGSVTSTKQFVWCADDRCEERDGFASLTIALFDEGQKNGSSKYFYIFDDLSSIRLMTDNSGNIQANYAYDPFGRVAKLSEMVPSEFGFASYYVHARSGLNLTIFRAYSPSLGRWLSRDLLQDEDEDIIEWYGNTYAYSENDPVNLTDPLGLFPWGKIIDYCIKASKNAKKVKPLPKPRPPGVKNRPDPERAKKSKESKKARATDAPSWSKGQAQKPGESAQDFAKRILDDKYGEGGWGKGPGSEYNQIVKATTRG